MTKPLDLMLTEGPRIACVGADLFSEALAAQGARFTQADWRPPAAGTEAALQTILGFRDWGSNTMRSLEQMLAVQPAVADIRPAREIFAAMDERTFFHAGPPIEWPACSGPLRGALIGAMIYEGLAENPEQASKLAESGKIALSPCHHHQAVGPMAGVISPSMPVFVVRDMASDRVAYATLNEGLGKVLRYGAFAPETIERLRWMEKVLAPILADALRRRGPVNLQLMMTQALQMGDDGHNRNRAGTSLFLREIGPALIDGQGDGAGSAADRAGVFRFIESNDHFVLNLVMAAAKLGCDAAAGVPGSSLVTTMARNGTEFGIRLSGTGDRWFTAPAPIIDGMYLGSYTAADANPDIGDSAITETVGLGGFAMAASPAIVGLVGGTAASAVQTTLAMYNITLTEHSAYRVPILESRGTPTGIDATLVVRTGITPQINTGVAGREPGVGTVGAGLVKAPMECFTAAVDALAAEIAG